MILADLSFFEHPRDAISSVLLNRHSLFGHTAIAFLVLKYGADQVLTLVVSSLKGVLC